MTDSRRSFYAAIPVPGAMALPPEDEEPEVPALSARPELRLIEASQARERTCADCGKHTSAWKPVRRQGVPLILCSECASKPPPAADQCPQCGGRLGPQDAFCGRCGARIEYACPQCGEALEPGDAFCGKCGARLG